MNELKVKPSKFVINVNDTNSLMQIKNMTYQYGLSRLSWFQSMYTSIHWYGYLIYHPVNPRIITLFSSALCGAKEKLKYPF